MRALLCTLLLNLLATPLTAQAGASAPTKPEPPLSPQAAYDQAIRPLEITRRSPKNWSEVELSALKVARENAKTACAAHDPDQTTSEDLLALAHLCAFGQQWQPVHQAAANYITAQSAPPSDAPNGSTELAMAFDYKVQASLSLKNPDDALLTAQTMLRTVAYDLYASEATSTTIEYLHFIRTSDALALLAQRQPILLALIKAHRSPSDSSFNSVEAPSNLPSPLALHSLYSDAITLPFMQQFANQPAAAAESYAALESSLPLGISSEDAMYIDEKRRQYLLLGTHLPPLKPTGFLLSPGATAPDNLNSWFAYAAVFLLFPDWCNQCVTMGFESAAKANELRDTFHVRFLSLLAQANPPEKPTQAPIKNVPLPPSRSGKPGQARSERLHVDQQLTMSSTPDVLLEGTPTVVVPNDTLNAFAAVDFPLLIATDHNGIIRWIERSPDDALTPGGDLDQIVQHVLATWPPD